MKNIILIANGLSSTKKKLGEVIDNFDNTVRFNNFIVDGYEEFVGRKINILAQRCADDVSLLPPENVNKVLAFMTYCRYSYAMAPVAHSLQRHYGEKAEIVPVSVCKGYAELLGLDTHNFAEHASVGTQAIIHLLKTYPVLHLYGFDYSSTNSHYFKRQPLDSQLHSWKKEITFIKKLEEEGKIIHVGV